jgi:hypothetical protein
VKHVLGMLFLRYWSIKSVLPPAPAAGCDLRTEDPAEPQKL